MKALSTFKHFPQIFTILSIVVLASCAQTDEAYTKLWDDKFSSCGNVCHSSSAGDGTDKGPDLSSKTKFYDNLVNKTAANYPDWVKTSTCDSLKFIAPGDANKSTLAGSLIQSVDDTIKATNSCDTSYNYHAVQGGVTISSSSSVANDLIKWINDGAKN